MDSVPYVAIAAAFLLIFIPRFVVGRMMHEQPGGYDNKDPRAQQAKLEGLGRRAMGAHMNGFEAFAPFAAGVLCASQRGVRVDFVAALAIVFVVARAGYVAAYLADRSTVRSGLWTLGMLAIGGLMLCAVIGP